MNSEPYSRNEGNEVPQRYRDILRKAGLSSDQMRELLELRDSKGAFDVAVTVATAVFTPVLFYLFPHPITGVVCVLLTIRVLNSFAQVVHGSGHGKLFTSRFWNDAVGDFAAAMVGYTRHGHRAAHQRHHIHLNTPEDADLIWGHPHEKVAEMAPRWLGDIFFVSAIKRLLQYLGGDKRGGADAKASLLASLWGLAWKMMPVALVQLTLLALYWVLVGPEYYFLFYVLPVMTLYPAQIRLRTMVEHSFSPLAPPSADGDGVWVTRSIKANPLERFVLAPLGMEYHFEHHLLPAVPYYNLPRARKMLEENGFEVPTAPGYFGYVVSKWRTERRQELALAKADV